MLVHADDSLTAEITDAGIAWLRVRSGPVFSLALLSALEQALAKLRQESGLKLCVLWSDQKLGFLAGFALADLQPIFSPGVADAWSSRGQQLCAQLASWSVPSLAWLHGACLGEGCELALACDWRAAPQGAPVHFAFPQNELGLLPCWGGTQRLPGLLGLERSLKLLLGWQKLDADQALQQGLLDALVPTPLGATNATTPPAPDALVLWAAQQGKRITPSLPGRTLRQKFYESTKLGRTLLLRGLGRAARRRVPDDVTAPTETIEAVRVGLHSGAESGYREERLALVRLVQTAASQHLFHIHALHEKERQLAAELRPSLTIRRLGLVGGGPTALSLAQLALLKGYDVVWQHESEASLGQHVWQLTEQFERECTQRQLSAEWVQACLSRLKGTVRWEGFEQVNLALEFGPDTLTSKQSGLQQLAAKVRPSTLLATTTNTLSLDAVATSLPYPERIASLHLLAPIAKCAVLELGRSRATSASTVTVLQHWAGKLGKTALVVQAEPGYVVLRCFLAGLDEAALLVAEGLEIAQLDELWRRLGVPWGIFEHADRLGLAPLQRLAEALSARYVDRFACAGCLAGFVERGWLGVAQQQGFYRYRRDRKQRHKLADNLLRESLRTEASARSEQSLSIRLAEARERLLLRHCNEAARCLAEGSVKSVESLDLALVLSSVWPAARGGPIRYARERRVNEVVQSLAQWARRLGSRFEPSEYWQSSAATGG